MKEISEEEQWEIFELLEGNLSDEQSKIILNKIKSNSELAYYYSSLKQTYLEKEESIIYQNKQSLIKKSAWNIYVSPIKYAAAAVVVLCVSYLFYNNQPASIQIQSKLAKNETKKIIDPIDLNKKEQPIPFKSTTKVTLVNLNSNSTQNIPLEILSLNKFNKHKKEFNPSTKLIEESEFYNNLTANNYLTEDEKKQIMLKWLLIHSANSNNYQEECIEPVTENNVAFNEVKLDNNNQLSKQWIREVKQMIRRGTLPKIKFVSSRKKEKWLPTFGIQVNTENAAMVANIID